MMQASICRLCIFMCLQMHFESPPFVEPPLESAWPNKLTNLYKSDKSMQFERATCTGVMKATKVRAHAMTICHIVPHLPG